MGSDCQAPNDAELVDATLAGDREAFARLYDRHARGVLAVAIGVSGDWAGADDLSQECFLRAYRNLAKLREPHRFRHWLIGIARQVARERRRALGRDRHSFGDPAIAALESNFDQHSHAAKREQLEIVLRALGQLSEQERSAIHAYYLQSRDATHAADTLGLSRSGFYALLKRATARLAAQIQPAAQKEGS